MVNRVRTSTWLPVLLVKALLLASVVFLVNAETTLAQLAADAGGQKLLLAFCSVRERSKPPYPMVYFYERNGFAHDVPGHEGAAGQLIGSIDSVAGGVNNTRADMHPALSRDGRYCVFASQFGVANGGRIEVWDRVEKKLLALGEINDHPGSHQMTPSFSSDRSLVAFAAYGRPGGNSRWGIFLYDLAAQRMLPSPRPNDSAVDDRMPAISGDGRFVAFATHGRGEVRLTDIYLCDLQQQSIDKLPEMNSSRMDIQPSLSGDGRLLAFSSDRPGGVGGRDIYLYDRAEKAFVPLEGLNSAFAEQSPALSADGRWLAFVSERLDGAGERDVYLYDRDTRSLLPLPGLNSKDDDFDPTVVVLPAMP